MSSRLPTSWLSRSVSSSMAARKSAVSRVRPRHVARARRLDTDALIEASGVRRSCDTALSSAVRSSLARSSAAASARTAADSEALRSATVTYSGDHGGDDEEHDEGEDVFALGDGRACGTAA